ncbi:hypothetical protein [Methylobacterium sp. A54F]
MGCVQVESHNVVPFRRIAAQGSASKGSARGAAPGSPEGLVQRRSEQRALMDAVYATGTLAVAAGDRETKLTASRLQVYGFLSIEEVGEDGAGRRLRPSEAIRARTDRPWRLARASYGGFAVSIPAADGFLFEASGLPA